MFFYEPTIRMTDIQFLYKWANLQNQQGITYLFPLPYKNKQRYVFFKSNLCKSLCMWQK